MTEPEVVVRQPLHYEGMWIGDACLMTDGTTHVYVEEDHPNVALVQMFLIVRNFKVDPDDSLHFIHHTLQELDGQEASHEPEA
jgi:hypothetical protein